MRNEELLKKSLRISRIGNGHGFLRIQQIAKGFAPPFLIPHSSFLIQIAKLWFPITVFTVRVRIQRSSVARGL